MDDAVPDLRLAEPKAASVSCPKCLGKLWKYMDDPHFHYCATCRMNVMVVDGEAYEEVA